MAPRETIQKRGLRGRREMAPWGHNTEDGVIGVKGNGTTGTQYSRRKGIKGNGTTGHCTEGRREAGKGKWHHMTQYRRRQGWG